MDTPALCMPHGVHISNISIQLSYNIEPLAETKLHKIAEMGNLDRYRPGYGRMKRVEIF